MANMQDSQNTLPPNSGSVSLSTRNQTSCIRIALLFKKPASASYFILLPVPIDASSDQRLWRDLLNL